LRALRENFISRKEREGRKELKREEGVSVGLFVDTAKIRNFICQYGYFL
jgi:hypothetical protein